MDTRQGKTFRILLVGGGTGGSVSPLLALAEEIKSRPEGEGAQFLFIGTKNGPEREMVAKQHIPFESIPAGKLRRYFTVKNTATPFLVFAGFVKALSIIRRFKPDVVVGTGSFVQVPAMWAARVTGIPVVLHQQDVVPSLANTLCQTIASAITVTFESSLKDFASGIGLFESRVKQKVFWVGNPAHVPAKIRSRKEALETFGLKDHMPTILVTGGGTGAAGINRLIEVSAPVLVKTVQVIHQTGKGKAVAFEHEHYRQVEFISDMGEAYAAADIVICRAGLGTITELSALSKLAIIIPMPNSHQVYNADFLAQKHAAIVLPQETAASGVLLRLVRKLLFEAELQKELKENIRRIMPVHASKKFADVVIKAATRVTFVK